MLWPAIEIFECGDVGDPIVHKYPDSPIAKSYLALAETVGKELQRSAPQELPGLQM